MNKQRAIHIAAGYFPNYPSVNKFHITKDGQAFESYTNALNNARGIDKDELVIDVTRADVEAEAKATKTPKAPAALVAPVTPEVPEAPEAPETPVTPEAPAAPEVTEPPAAPVAPAKKTAKPAPHKAAPKK